MSVGIANSPSCSIRNSYVTQGNLSTNSGANVFDRSQSMATWIDLNLAQFIWFTSGYFNFYSRIYSANGSLVRVNPWTGWTASDLPGRPNPSILLSWFFSRADAAANGGVGVFYFEPEVSFNM